MTLVEVLVVMAIIGLILGVSIPSFMGYTSQARLKTTTRQVVGLLSLARHLAISAHEDHAVIVTAEEVRVVNVVTGKPTDRKLTIPSSVSIEVQNGGEPAQDSQLVFRPTGALNGRTTTLVISCQGKQQTITVTGITGAISVQ
jgi:prepilin-type N-terminal cleavage/methylation domain-containing protein